MRALQIILQLGLERAVGALRPAPAPAAEPERLERAAAAGERPRP